MASYIAIPCIAACLRRWAFDQVVDLLPYSQQLSKSNNEKLESSGWLYNLFSLNTKNILSRGLFPCPNWVYSRPDKYQSFPPKWKFTILVYVAVLMIDMPLWCTLYRFGFRHWHWTNIQDIEPKNNNDMRLRYMLFVWLDLMIQIPIVSYTTLPFLTNRVFVKWAYKKIDDVENNVFMWFLKKVNKLICSGISIIEQFDVNQIMMHHMSSKNGQSEKKESPEHQLKEQLERAIFN